MPFSTLHHYSKYVNIYTNSMNCIKIVARGLVHKVKSYKVYKVATGGGRRPPPVAGSTFNFMNFLTRYLLYYPHLNQLLTL